MKQLRRQVVLQMVRVHRISRALAILHVSKMETPELLQRLDRYQQFPEAGMELSVMERHQQSRPDFYQVFGSTTAPARSTALNPVPAPALPIEPRNGQGTARAGNKKPGPMVDRAISASH